VYGLGHNQTGNAWNVYWKLSPIYNGGKYYTAPEEITISGAANVGIGLTTQFTAVVTPSDVTVNDIRWTSNNPAVATVDSNGLVTGISIGEATITATTVDGIWVQEDRVVAPQGTTGGFIQSLTDSRTVTVD